MCSCIKKWRKSCSCIREKETVMYLLVISFIAATGIFFKSFNPLLLHHIIISISAALFFSKYSNDLWFNICQWREGGGEQILCHCPFKLNLVPQFQNATLASLSLYCKSNLVPQSPGQQILCHSSWQQILCHSSWQQILCHSSWQQILCHSSWQQSLCQSSWQQILCHSPLTANLVPQPLDSKYCATALDSKSCATVPWQQILCHSFFKANLVAQSL